MAATFVGSRPWFSTQDPLPRLAGALNGDLAIVTTTQTRTTPGWTRVAAIGGTGGAYYRFYDGTALDEFPMLEAVPNDSSPRRQLSVWRNALGISDVHQDALLYRFGPTGTPNAAVTLPSRTTDRRAATYVHHGNIGVPNLTYTAVPVSPLVVRQQGKNQPNPFTSAFYVTLVTSVDLVDAGPTPNYSFSLVSTTATGGATGTDFTFVLIPTNLPPNAAILSSTGALARDSVNRLSWRISDPNPGDTQSKADLRYRRTGTTAWTDVAVPGPNPFYDVPASTLVLGDYEWQVRTYDAEGLVGPYSASGFFTVALPPPGPTITAPINGSTVTLATVALAWSSSSQTHYQTQVVADSSGSPDPSVVLYDSGEVASTTTRQASLPLPTNSVYRHLRVRVKNDGLYGPWASVRILVSYTPPATPTAAVVAVQTVTSMFAFTDAVRVSVNSPTATGGQPAIAYYDLWVRATSAGDRYRPVLQPVRIATQLGAGIAFDRAAAHGVDYEYRAQAYGSNGVTSESPWVGAGSVVTPPLPPDPNVDDPVETTVSPTV